MAFDIDIICPTYNRPDSAFRLIEQFISLAASISRVRLCVLNDGSDDGVCIDEIDYQMIQKLCDSSEKVLYRENNKNVGLAQLIHDYYQSNYKAEFSFLLNDKDSLVTISGLTELVDEMRDNKKLNFIMTSLKQLDRVYEGRNIELEDRKYTGKEFLESYVSDENIRHCGMYSILRNQTIADASFIKTLNLRERGLNDAFGFDIQIVMGITGFSDEVMTVKKCFVHRSIVGGATERFPLSFAVCYYQYAKQITSILYHKDRMSKNNLMAFRAWWHRLICTGWITVYNPVHKFDDNKFEKNTKLVNPITKLPLPVYLLIQIIFNRFYNWSSIKTVYFLALKCCWEAFWVGKRPRFSGFKSFNTNGVKRNFFSNEEFRSSSGFQTLDYQIDPWNNLPPINWFGHFDNKVAGQFTVHQDEPEHLKIVMPGINTNCYVVQIIDLADFGTKIRSRQLNSSVVIFSENNCFELNMILNGFDKMGQEKNISSHFNKIVEKLESSGKYQVAQKFEFQNNNKISLKLYNKIRIGFSISSTENQANKLSLYKPKLLKI